MPSNDDVVWGVPQVQCPSCEFILDLSGQKVHKYSKAQCRQHASDPNGDTSNYVYGTYGSTTIAPETPASTAPHNTFVVVSCSNERCEQYNKLKVLRIPRLAAPCIHLDL